MELPKFKYSPNAYKIDVFKEGEGTCSVCNQHRKIKYESSFYSAKEPEYICPWCIADVFVSQRQIDFEPLRSRSVIKIHIIRAEEHPDFSPEWLANDWCAEEILERELTIDDLEIELLSKESKVQVPPPPPPTPPSSGEKMLNIV